MQNQTNIEKLITSGKSVFTTEDLAVIWNISDHQKLIERIKYYLRKKRLVHIHRGVYAYGEYTPLDVAQKLVPLSYMSLYTTSQMHGLTFQHYQAIYCMSLNSRTYELKAQKYIYHRVKEEIFYSDQGLVNQGRYIIAGKERTICDLLYVFPGFAFDNLEGVDPELLQKISHIYNNKRLQKEVTVIVTEIQAGKN